uniref:Uncharacterized protein n=1 Tax=Arion vulgaris TaxID=1028688 RepID=A0A0B7AQ73_9EUPU
MRERKKYNRDEMMEKIVRVTRMDKNINETIRDSVGTTQVLEHIQKQQNKLFEHLT